MTKIKTFEDVLSDVDFNRVFGEALKFTYKHAQETSGFTTLYLDKNDLFRDIGTDGPFYFSGIQDNPQDSVPHGKMLGPRAAPLVLFHTHGVNMYCFPSRQDIENALNDSNEIKQYHEIKPLNLIANINKYNSRAYLELLAFQVKSDKQFTDQEVKKLSRQFGFEEIIEEIEDIPKYINQFRSLKASSYVFPLFVKDSNLIIPSDVRKDIGSRFRLF